MVRWVSEKDCVRLHPMTSTWWPFLDRYKKRAEEFVDYVRLYSGLDVSDVDNDDLLAHRSLRQSLTHGNVPVIFIQLTIDQCLVGRECLGWCLDSEVTRQSSPLTSQVIERFAIPSELDLPSDGDPIKFTLSSFKSPCLPFEADRMPEFFDFMALEVLITASKMCVFPEGFTSSLVHTWHAETMLVKDDLIFATPLLTMLAWFIWSLAAKKPRFFVMFKSTVRLLLFRDLIEEGSRPSKKTLLLSLAPNAIMPQDRGYSSGAVGEAPFLASLQDVKRDLADLTRSEEFHKAIGQSNRQLLKARRQEYANLVKQISDVKGVYMAWVANGVDIPGFPRALDFVSDVTLYRNVHEQCFNFSRFCSDGKHPNIPVHVVLTCLQHNLTGKFVPPTKQRTFEALPSFRGIDYWFKSMRWDSTPDGMYAFLNPLVSAFIYQSFGMAAFYGPPSQEWRDDASPETNWDSFELPLTYDWVIRITARHWLLREENKTSGVWYANTEVSRAPPRNTRLRAHPAPAPAMVVKDVLPDFQSSPQGEDAETRKLHECSICYSRQVNTALDPCGHVFCDQCVTVLDRYATTRVFDIRDELPDLLDSDDEDSAPGVTPTVTPVPAPTCPVCRTTYSATRRIILL